MWHHINQRLALCHLEFTVAHASRTPATFAEKDDKEHIRQHGLKGADTARIAPGRMAGVMLNSCQVKKHAAEDDTAGKDLKLKEKKCYLSHMDTSIAESTNPPTGRKCTNFRTVNCLWRRKKNRLEKKKNQMWQNSMGRVQGFILITIFCIFEIFCNLQEFNKIIIK